MIHYHGAPLGGQRDDVVRFFKGRNALVPFPRPEDLPTVLEVCQTVIVDNGAFTAHCKGQSVTDWTPYYEWVDGMIGHPRFRWALIPDVIGGDEEQNDELIEKWPHKFWGVPVWHMHESLERLERLSREWKTVALGSSGDYWRVGDRKWWGRMSGAMDRACVNGRPRCALHALRMLNPAIFKRLPLASADSTNVAQNGPRKASEMSRYKIEVGNVVGREVLAQSIESQQSAAEWKPCCFDRQASLFEEFANG